jgi:hypothetical protein
MVESKSRGSGTRRQQYFYSHNVMITPCLQSRPRPYREAGAFISAEGMKAAVHEPTSFGSSSSPYCIV